MKIYELKCETKHMESWSNEMLLKKQKNCYMFVIKKMVLPFNN